MANTPRIAIDAMGGDKGLAVMLAGVSVGDLAKLPARTLLTSAISPAHATRLKQRSASTIVQNDQRHQFHRHRAFPMPGRVINCCFK